MPSLLPVRIARPRPSRVADLAFDLVRESGLTPLAVAATDPGLVVVHEPGDPALRAALLDRLHRRLDARRVRAFTPHEWAIWRTVHEDRFLRGSLDAPAPDAAAPLRRAAALHLQDLPAALARRDDARPVAAAQRAALERVASPNRFPLVPAPDAGPRAIDAAAIGVFHVALSPHQEAAPGEPASAAPHPTAAAARAAVDALLADLPPQTNPVEALYLHPGPAGFRHGWRLLAVLPDDVPLHAAAGLRERLTQHVRLTHPPPAFPRLAEPWVLPTSTLGALLRGRLFFHPSERLAFEQHRVLLRGTDVAEHLVGASLTADDLRLEAAALLDLTATLWASDATALLAHELTFGAWPTLLAHARGTNPATALADLEGSADPALARAAAGPPIPGWGTDAAADLARPTAFLRDWGPTLLRLQEVALEALA